MYPLEKKHVQYLTTLIYHQGLCCRSLSPPAVIVSSVVNYAQVRADPVLEADEQTYAAAINCFQQYVKGNPVASLSSTMLDAESLSGMSSMWTPAPVDDTVEGKYLTDHDDVTGDNSTQKCMRD